MAWSVHDGVYRLESEALLPGPCDLAYQVVADVRRYPEFLPDVVSVRSEGDSVEMVLRVGPMVIPVTNRVAAEPGKWVEFSLLEGPVKRMVGRWDFAPTDGGTLVKVTTEVQPHILGGWLARMTAPVLDGRTNAILAAFRRRITEVQQS